MQKGGRGKCLNLPGDQRGLHGRRGARVKSSVSATWWIVVSPMKDRESRKPGWMALEYCKRQQDWKMMVSTLKRPVKKSKPKRKRSVWVDHVLGRKKLPVKRQHSQIETTICSRLQEQLCCPVKLSKQTSRSSCMFFPLFMTDYLWLSSKTILWL